MCLFFFFFFQYVQRVLRIDIDYVPRAKWRRGWHKLKTLVGTFTIFSYMGHFLLIFLSRIVTQSALYICDM